MADEKKKRGAKALAQEVAKQRTKSEVAAMQHERRRTQANRNAPISAASQALRKASRDAELARRTESRSSDEFSGTYKRAQVAKKAAVREAAAAVALEKAKREARKRNKRLPTVAQMRFNKRASDREDQ